MKKLYYILPILLITFAFQACKTTEEAVDLKETVSEAPADGADIAMEEVVDESPVLSDSTTDRALFASIERTFCFGRCPVYKMKIYADGSVEYEGIQNMVITGKYTTILDKSQMNAFLKKAEEIKFYELEDRYDDEMVTDLPSTTLTVIDDKGELKTVFCRYQFPKRINGLAEMFDNLLKSESWTSESGEIYPPER